MKRIIASILIPAFVAATVVGCTPTQTTVAKSTFTKVAFYVDLATQLIKVAETNYASDQKVQTALAATRSALLTVSTLMGTLEAGVEKDESKLSVALVALVSSVFSLMSAIKAAQAASATSAVNSGSVATVG